MRENQFQAKLIKRLMEDFPGCFVIKNDPTYIQGFPDLLILHQDKWAALEVKASKDAPHRPNQDHYVRTLGGISFAAFIYPENTEEVLGELQRTFRAGRGTRIPKRQ